MENTFHTAAELRIYLLQRRNGRSRGLIAGFESFLKDFSSLFALRASAEEYWSGSPHASTFGHEEHRYEADNIRGALPLEWNAIKKVLLPENDESPTTLITHVATHCVEEVRMIASGMRRILSRERVSTPVGKVQQLDNYCMRWLMRQPGRGFAEKAGTRQRVMAVVRREQFDTLENRVFKDFLIRAENLADGYLVEFSKYKTNQTYQAVRSFKIACQGALMIPEMDQISGLTSLPQPNYVLQQDNRYSKIWTTYCRIVKFANLAEKWWGHKNELELRLERLKEECKWQLEHRGRTVFFSRIWFEELDVVPSFMENAHTHHAEVTEEERSSRERESRLVSPEGGVAVVDLSGSHAYGNALIKGGYHPNARSRIYSQQFPFLDDELALRDKKAERIELSRIFPVINDEKLQDGRGSDYELAVANATEYCARLYGELHNADRTLDELVVLSPDDWNVVTQETVIRSFPMIDRQKVHLLWRSVATVLGLNAEIARQIKEGESVAVVDFRNDDSVLVTALKYLKEDEVGHLIPQRSVCRKNGGLNGSRYYISKSGESAKIIDSSPVRESRVLCLSGNVPTSFKSYLEQFCAYAVDKTSATVICGRAERGQSSWVVLEDKVGSWAQRKGAFRFIREHEQRTLYFDELEPMWVVGQKNEQIVKWPLVKGDERFPGGRAKSFAVQDGLLKILAGAKGVKFLFHIGALTDNTPLHSYSDELLNEVVYRDVPLEGVVNVSPGQGIAITTVNASVFKNPIVLDYLTGMKLIGDTIRTLEEQLPRSFPPMSATVEAFANSCEYGIFNFMYEDEVENVVRRFLNGKIALSDIDNGLFAHAIRLTDKDLKSGESRLRLLDRRNVFGNMPGHLRPQWMTEPEETELLDRLTAAENRKHGTAIRLLAWTYRGSHKGIGIIATRLVEKYKCRQDEPQGLLPEECSFLANTLFDEALIDLEVSVFNVFNARCAKGYANANDYRLIYNILQFDVDVFDKIKFPEKWMVSIFSMLLNAIAEYRKGGNSNCYQFSLRCVLYFLRYREHNSDFLRSRQQYAERFFRSDERAEQMSDLYDRYVRELGLKLDRESLPVGVIRRATSKFISGRGTLDDVIGIGE